MKRNIIIMGATIIVFPFLGGVVAFVFFDKNIFDNPDFWYAYMAYFSTVFLAIVALLQNANAEEANKRFMMQQLRQKVGYFSLQEATEERKRINQYGEISVSDKKMNIGLKNVGEDIILNPRITSLRINGKVVECPCSLNVVFKMETIFFQFDFEKKNQEKDIKVLFDIMMENISGVVFKQHFSVELELDCNQQDSTFYFVKGFNTNIIFCDE